MNNAQRRFVPTPTAKANPDQLVNEATAAATLAIEARTLATWRHKGRYSLPFTRIGGAVRYKTSDLHRFIESRTVNTATTATR